jgi:DNA-binding MarR family transcriptional regulator
LATAARFTFEQPDRPVVPWVSRLALVAEQAYSSYLNEMADRLPLQVVIHAAHAVQDEIEAKLSAIGLSGAKFAALKALSESAESLPLTQLADRLSCVKSNITQLVDRLEADGLVARKPDPRDRRSRLAELTAAGRKAVKDGTRVLDAAEREVLGRLTRDEAQQLRRLLDKMGTAAT